MRPKGVVLTVMLAGILTSSAIQLGQRWLRAEEAVGERADRGVVQRYAGGPEWFNR